MKPLKLSLACAIIFTILLLPVVLLCAESTDQSGLSDHRRK